LLTNKLENFTISIVNPIDNGTTVDLYIYKKRNTKKKVYFINDSPYIDVDVSIKARIVSTNKNSEELTNENIEKLEQSVNSYLEKQISNFLYKTSLDYNSDICSLGKYGVSQFKTNSNWESYNWLENYKNSIFNVNVNCTVISSLLFTEV
jgi:hypothetical protein